MSASKATRAAVATRRARLIQLKLKGVPYEEIAVELGYATDESDGVSTARKDFTRACRAASELEQEAADTWRETERQRYDAIQAAYWDDAMEGNAKAAEIVIVCIRERRKLLGVDAPIQVDATITEVTQQDIALQEMIAEAKARNALRMQALQADADGSTE